MSQIDGYRSSNDNVWLEYRVTIYIKEFCPVIIELDSES